VPALARTTIKTLLDEMRMIEARIAQLELDRTQAAKAPLATQIPPPLASSNSSTLEHVLLMV
jgi:hypothetical protein